MQKTSVLLLCAALVATVGSANAQDQTVKPKSGGPLKKIEKAVAGATKDVVKGTEKVGKGAIKGTEDITKGAIKGTEAVGK